MPPPKLDLQSYDTLSPQLDLQPYEKPEQSTTDWWIEQALRTAPAVVGGLGGGLVGGVPGGMAGGAAGSAIGDILGNWYSGKEFNPTEFAVTTALGGVPPILGPAKFAGQGLGAIAKYAGSSALRGATEGAVVGAAGTPFQHYAQTGDFNAPLEEYLQSAGAGGLMGGVLGGGMGAYHGGKLNAPPVEAPPTPRVEPPPQFGRTPPEVYGPEIGPYGLGEGQQNLPLKPHISAADFIAMREAQPPPPVDAGGQGLLFPPETLQPPTPPAAPAAPVQQAPPGSSLSENGQVVTIAAPDASLVQYWRDQGFVPVQGLRSAEGHAQMVRGDLAPLYVTGDKKLPPTPRPTPTESPFGANRVVPGDEIPVPVEKLTQTYVDNLAEGGFKEARREGGIAFFKRFITEDKGTFDPQEMWKNLKRMLGRDPTPEEVEAGMQRQVRPGEQTGRVAPFTPRDEFSPIAIPRPPEIPAERWNTLDDYQKSQYLRDKDEWDIGEGYPAIRPPRTPIPNPAGIPGLESAYRSPADVPPPAEFAPGTIGAELPFNPPETPPLSEHQQAIEDLYRRARELGVNPDDYRSAGELAHALDEGDPGAMRPPRPYETELPPTDMGVAIDELRARSRMEQIGGELPPSDEPEFARARPPDEYPQMHVARAKLLQEAAPKDPNKRLDLGIINSLGQIKSVTIDPRADLVHEDFFGHQGTHFRYYSDKNEVMWLEGNPTPDEYWKVSDQYPNAVHTDGYGNTIHPPAPDEPALARVQGGGLTASVDIRRAVENITRDYTSPLPGIMNREGMQNALDAADKLGTGGEVRARLNYTDNTLEIADNGHGLDEDGLATKLVEIFATGKEGEEGATGGKGIGSASYIYGGEHFTVESVAVDRNDGLKYRITASGTPDQFLDPVKGSDFERVPVPNETPTGTTITVKLKDDQNLSHASRMLDNIVENSRNRSSRILVDDAGYTSGPLRDVDPTDPDFKEHRFAQSKDDKLIGDITTRNRNSKVEILVPRGLEGTRESIDIHYLNNGMYQFSETMHLPSKGDGVPEKVLIDIHPLVDDQNELYPFINTREDIKKDIREEVVKYVKDNIASPGISRRKNRVQQLYDSMSPVPVRNTLRKSIIYDPGERLTPKEMASVTSNPVIQKLVQTYDTLINDILRATGRQRWADRLEGVGLVFDPGMHGIHIPNPATGKSTILINPFIRIGDIANPAEAAWRNVGTNLHEVAHIGTESGTPIKLTPKDLQDPRVGEFLSRYMNEIVTHGDVGWAATGHAMDFAHRLGEVYAKFGVDSTFRAADELHKIFTGGQKSGKYSPEIQKLLQLYTESRGRAATTEDLLSGTGVKSANRGRDTAGNIPGNRPTDGNGTTPTRKEGIVKQLYHAPRGLMASWDFSAPLRQGLPMIHTKEWWTSWAPMMKSWGSKTAYESVMNDIRSRPEFQRVFDPETGKFSKSHAEESGLKLTDITEGITGREENTVTGLIEKVPGVARSNRAYTAYLNSLRADSFRTLLNSAEKAGMSPRTDLVLSKAIAEYVNTATGRGSLGQFEQNAKLLSDVFFAPRLIASRLRMLNPATYVMAPPFVRKQYLGSLLATAGAWTAMAGLAKVAGANVSLDPSSSDFGKIRIGNTRIDPAGGFQQYLVAAYRLTTGNVKSSGSAYETGGKFPAPTRLEVGQRFVTNKLNPVLDFAYDLLAASKQRPVYGGDRLAQMAMPMIIADVFELAKENPDLIPLVIPATAVGMGSQSYERGKEEPKILPRVNDPFKFEGGAMF